MNKIVAQYNGQSAVGATQQVQKLQNRASIDCGKFIQEKMKNNFTNIFNFI